jgi:ribonuclease HI
MTDRALVAVFADESCLGNGREGENPGGAGALIEYRRAGGGALVRRDLWLSEPATTNNRMALRSVIAAFTQLGLKGKQFDVVFTTDSRYIVDGMRDWVHGWAKRGWKRKTGAIENLGLWSEAILAARGHRVSWRWVRGHAGHAQNEYANDLAVRAAERLDASAGLVESGFDEWFASAKTQGAKHADPVAFPDHAGFRADAPLPAPPSLLL